MLHYMTSRAALLAVLLAVVKSQPQCRLADSLAADLKGQLSKGAVVMLPSSPEYRRDIVLRSTNFNSFPAVIVHPATVADVVKAVKFAKKNTLKITVKGTGHDYNGRCSADGSININTRLLNDVSFDIANNKTFFGAGASFGDVLRPAVLKHGRAVVSGHDLTVGPGGCLLGGCHSGLSRQYGLGADNVVSVVLVTPEGQLVKASSKGVHSMSTLPDGSLSKIEGPRITNSTALFWALRGGGGGTFGVAVQFSVKLVPAPTAVHGVTVAWPLYDNQGKPIRDMFDRFVFNSSYWQSLGPKWAAWAVGSVPGNCTAPQGTTQGTGPECVGTAALSFIYTGNDPLVLDKSAGIKSILQNKAPWVSDITYFKTTTVYKNYYDYMYQNADTSNYLRQFVSNVLLAEKDMSPTATEKLYAALQTMQFTANVPLKGPDSFETVGYVISIVGGGAVAAHPEASKTAISRTFRNFVAELVLSTGGRDPTWDHHAYQAVSDAIKPLYTAYPGSYQNEVSSLEGFNRIPNWQARFWGDNYDKLLEVKRQYDIDNMMNVPYTVGWTE